MDGTVSTARTSLTSAEALIVEPSFADGMFWSSVLTSAGFHVTVTRTFHEGKTRLSVHPPAVLLTELRLSDYNGLHLVLRAKAVRTTICAIVASDSQDPVLQTEAERMGATFLIKPTTREELLAAVFRTLFCTTADPVRPPFERRALARREREMPLSHADRRSMPDRRHDPFAIVRSAPHADMA